MPFKSDLEMRVDALEEQMRCVCKCAAAEKAPAPRDIVQVGDEIEVTLRHGQLHVVRVWRHSGRLVVDAMYGDQLPTSYFQNQITRIVTRATPRVGDTVEMESLVGVVGTDWVYYHDGSHDMLTTVAPRLRIVHRPEGRE